MKKRINLLYILAAILFHTLFFSSCSEGETCSSGGLEALCLEDLGCKNAMFNVVVESSNEFELIRDQESFERLVKTSCQVKIDWLQYDMIAGMIETPSRAIRIEKSLVKDCRFNQIRLNFTIFVDESLISGRISFNALIPKLQLEEDLIVQLNPK